MSTFWHVPSSFLLTSKKGSLLSLSEPLVLPAQPPDIPPPLATQGDGFRRERNFPQRRYGREGCDLMILIQPLAACRPAASERLRQISLDPMLHCTFANIGYPFLFALFLLIKRRGMLVPGTALHIPFPGIRNRTDSPRSIISRYPVPTRGRISCLRDAYQSLSPAFGAPIGKFLGYRKLDGSSCI